MTGPAQKGAEDAVWPGSDTINGLAGNAICSAISALAQAASPTAQLRLPVTAAPIRGCTSDSAAPQGLSVALGELHLLDLGFLPDNAAALPGHLVAAIRLSKCGSAG